MTQCTETAPVGASKADKAVVLTLLIIELLLLLPTRAGSSFRGN
jgi:hypothetical protein